MTTVQELPTIGDTSRDGLLQITDTTWDHNGTIKVTVRELIGQRWEDYPGGKEQVIRRARTLARSTLMHPEHTRSSRVLRTWFAEGCSHVTFAVSRNSRY